TVSHARACTGRPSNSNTTTSPSFSVSAFGTRSNIESLCCQLPQLGWLLATGKPDRQPLDMSSSQRDPAVATCHEYAGVCFGLLVYGKTIGCHDPQTAPAPYDTHMAQHGKVTDGFTGNVCQNMAERAVVHADIFMRVTNLN